MDVKFLKYAVVVVFILCRAEAQPTAAPAPAPPGPLNITKILEKARQFQTLMRLMMSTQVVNQINMELNNSNGGAGLTLFAPTDNAFSSLPAGTLNSLTNEQKVSLIQFHVLPNLVTVSQFQTVSNPVRTQAGGQDGAFPLNVTTTGNSVNISTGIVNTTVANTIYSDDSLAVYEVDKVLLPLQIFRPSAVPAPPPEAPEKKKKKDDAADSPDSSDSNDAATSAATGRMELTAARGFVVAVGVGVLCWKL